VTTRADFREPAVIFSDLYCRQPAVYKAVLLGLLQCFLVY